MLLESGYTTVNEILARLNSNPYISGDFDTNHAVMMIGDAVRLANVREMYEFDCKVFTFDNYSLKLPDGFKKLIDVGYSNTQNCNKSISADDGQLNNCITDLISRIGCKEQDECGNDVFTGWDYGKFVHEYNILLNSNKSLYNISSSNETGGVFTPMQPSTSTLGTEYDRTDVYTFSLTQSVLRFNVKSGFVILSYLKHPVDEKGQMLIIDDIHLIKNIVDYYNYSNLEAKYFSSVEGNYERRWLAAKTQWLESLAVVKGRAKTPANFKEYINVGRVFSSGLVNRQGMGLNSYFGYMGKQQEANYNKAYNNYN